MRKRILSMLLVCCLLAALLPTGVIAAGNFSDVDENAYYAEAVQWAYEAGVTTGKTATTFGAPMASLIQYG